MYAEIPARARPLAVVDLMSDNEAMAFITIVVTVVVMALMA
jgi:hypothetical protein